LGRDTIESTMRERVRDLLEAIVEEELEAASGAPRSARVGEARHGYRHGTRPRTVTTSLGPTTIAMPRARVRGSEGTSVEWRSATVARYQRRTARVDEAVLGVYLAGTNTRRVQVALAPLLRGGPLSKDAVSRLVGRLRDASTRGAVGTWRPRTFATYSWMAGIRRSASAAVGRGCQCW
jgi:transposase-like protein